VANQTLDQSLIEMIVIDDGSTDQSLELIASYVSLIPNMRVVRHPHTGLPGVLRNVAIGMASGDYILFLDSDDYLGLEALERLHAFVSKGVSDVIAFQLEGLGRGVPRSMFSRTARNVNLASSGVYKTLGTWKLCRRHFLVENGLYFSVEHGRGEDVLFFIEAMLRAEVVSVVSGYPFYTVRGRHDGTSITQRPWVNSTLIDVVSRMTLTIERWAQDQDTADHFMIRAFNTDAMMVINDPNATTHDLARLKNVLGRFWTRNVEQLIYTNKNRGILQEFFGNGA
jgi:glycosyltransferase involved in cell wall biosynthesis